MWLKCVPRFYAHEALVLTHLAGQGAPGLLATQAHRMLLADMAGEDGYEASDDEQIEMVGALVDLQLAVVDDIDRQPAVRPCGRHPYVRNGPAPVAAVVVDSRAGFGPEPRVVTSTASSPMSKTGCPLPEASQDHNTWKGAR